MKFNEVQQTLTCRLTWDGLQIRLFGLQMFTYRARWFTELTQ